MQRQTPHERDPDVEELRSLLGGLHGLDSPAVRRHEAQMFDIWDRRPEFADPERYGRDLVRRWKLSRGLR